MKTQSFNFSFQVGGGRWDDKCIGEISPLFVSFFRSKSTPLGQKENGIIFLGEIIL
jgi:hypothetical protein